MQAQFRQFIFIEALSIASMQSVQATTINFDGLADGTVVNTLYSGVTFSNPFGNDVYARFVNRPVGWHSSPFNVVSLSPMEFSPFNTDSGAVEAVFVDGLQQTVSIDVAAVASSDPSGAPESRPYLEVYDATDNLLGKILFAGALPTSATEVTAFETLTFTSASMNIKKIRFSSEQTEGGPAIYGLFDTLTFAGQPPDPANNVPQPSVLSLLGIGALGLLGQALQRRRLQVSV